MSTSDGLEPAISNEEFEENAAVLMCEFNALREMLHDNHLKHEFEGLGMERTPETTAQQSGETERSDDELAAM